MIRKIQAMHKTYGIDPGHQCKECCNFVTGRYHDKILRKCRAYGMTHSEASDWAGGYEACALFGTPFDDKRNIPLIEALRRERPHTEDAPIPGQIGFERRNER